MFSIKFLHNIRFKDFTVFDLTTLFYLLFTGILSVVFCARLEFVSLHIIMRLVFAAAILLLIRLNQKNKSKFVTFMRNFYPMVFLGFFYSETDYFNNLFVENLDLAFSNFEFQLFNCQPSIEFSQLMPQRWFAELMHFSYFSYYLLIFGLTFWVYCFNKQKFEYVSNAVYTSFYVFYIIFTFLPVAGPQFFFASPYNQIPQGYVFGDLMKIVHAIGEGPTAAFPSSHVGIVVLMWFLSYRYARPILPYLLALGILLIASTVYLKAHYLIDVLGGALIVPLLYAIYLGVYKILSKKINS
jgi:membrane-associated phospholipid phosphatase